MSEQGSSELEQMQRTAEMFEMILQATPEAIENYESLKEIYRKLGRLEEVKGVFLRLADHYIQCNNLEAAKRELGEAQKEFPDDPSMEARLVELGVSPPPSSDALSHPDKEYSLCLSEYEELQRRCQDSRVRLRLAEQEREDAKLVLRTARQQVERAASEIEQMVAEAVKGRMELLRTAQARQAIRRGSLLYSELKVSFEDRIRRTVAEHASNLARGFRLSHRLLKELDVEYSTTLEGAVVQIDDADGEDPVRIRQEEERAKQRIEADLRDRYERARRACEGKEESCRRIAEEVSLVEKEKETLRTRVRFVIGRLAVEKQSHAEAEFAALSDELEIMPIMGHADAGGRTPTADGASGLDQLAREFDKSEGAAVDSGRASHADGIEGVAPPEGAATKISGVVERDVKAERKSRELGELLVKRGVITEKNLEKALDVQKKSGNKLGVVLIELGFATDVEILNCFATETGMPYLPLGSYEINSGAVKLLSGEVARRYGIVPVDIISNTLLVAMASPLDESAKKELEACVGNMKMSYYLSSPIEVEERLNELYPS